jgi:hypothetical protein
LRVGAAEQWSVPRNATSSRDWYAGSGASHDRRSAALVRSPYRCDDWAVSRSGETGVLAAIALVTLVTFVVFGIDTLGVIVLVICLVCAALLLARPED